MKMILISKHITRNTGMSTPLMTASTLIAMREECMCVSEKGFHQYAKYIINYSEACIYNYSGHPLGPSKLVAMEVEVNLLNNLLGDGYNREVAMIWQFKLHNILPGASL